MSYKSDSRSKELPQGPASVQQALEGIKRYLEEQGELDNWEMNAPEGYFSQPLDENHEIRIEIDRDRQPEEYYLPSVDAEHEGVVVTPTIYDDEELFAVLDNETDPEKAVDIASRISSKFGGTDNNESP